MDIWKMLNIKETTDMEEIERAYTIKLKRCYSESGSEKFQRLQQAYQEAKEFQKAKVKEEQINEKAERRQLMAEIEKLYYQNLTEEERPMLQEFFGTGLFYKHRLDSWLLDYRLMVFVSEYNHFSPIFLEEYLDFYDKVYEHTGSDVGLELYDTFSALLSEIDSDKQEYKEITENKKEWLLQYFFEEGFTRVWESTSKGAMKTVYRGILEEHLAALAEQHNYEWDLWSDGHLMALKDGDNYIFSYDRIGEQVTLPMEEYYQLLEEMFDVYMGKYFVVPSEKNKLNELKENAREIAYGKGEN